MPRTTDISLNLDPAGWTAIAALSARAAEQTRAADALLHDPLAAVWVERLGSTAMNFDHAATQIAVCVRAQLIDDWVRGWLSQHPEGIVVELGIGLSTRHARLNLRPEQTLGIDRPEIVTLRKSLGQSYPAVEADLADPHWLQELTPRREDRPVCFVAEGLLMYLDRGVVDRLLAQLARRSPDAMFCFDAYAPAAKPLARFHGGLRQTGAALRSTFAASPHLHIDQSHTLRDRPPAFARLPWLYRLPGVHRLYKTYRAELAASSQ